MTMHPSKPKKPKHHPAQRPEHDKPEPDMSFLRPPAVREPRNIGPYRKRLAGTGELVRAPRLDVLRRLDDGRKGLVLWPRVRVDDRETWSEVLREGVDREEIEMETVNLTLGYDYWGFSEVLRAILPPELHGDIPSSFNTAGHIAHLNLREPYLPYKALIGQALLDKNAAIRTVINKVDQVGAASEFRTFAYEVLAGDDDVMAEVHRSGCTFRFDYGSVYWNSKLEGEHRRVEALLRRGEVACDVMAGVGPFAVPAGRRGVWVLANDKNPASYGFLADAVARNKVGDFVRPYNLDGADFIRQSARLVLDLHQRGTHAFVKSSKPPSAPGAAATDAAATTAATTATATATTTTTPATTTTASTATATTAATAATATTTPAATTSTTTQDANTPRPKRSRAPPPRERVSFPPTPAHYIMNLPDSAITFLHNFRGIFAGHEALFSPATSAPMPLLHVHCFHSERDDGPAREAIPRRIEREMGVLLEVDEGDVVASDGGGGPEEGRLVLVEVRDVAPNKMMYCATFRLPRSVAFAEGEGEG